jgi:hypothetical protein
MFLLLQKNCGHLDCLKSLTIFGQQAHFHTLKYGASALITYRLRRFFSLASLLHISNSEVSHLFYEDKPTIPPSAASMKLMWIPLRILSQVFVKFYL